MALSEARVTQVAPVPHDNTTPIGNAAPIGKAAQTARVRHDGPAFLRNGHPIAAVHCSTTAFVGPLPAGPIDSAVAVDSLQALVRTFGDIRQTSPVLESARLFFENGGTNAIIIRTESPTVEAICGVEHYRSGLWQLLNHHVNLISIPDTRRMSLVDADEVFKTALEVAQQTDALYLLDPPEQLGRQPHDLDDWLPVHPHAAVYFPYLKRRDRSTGYETELALSGPVAGVIARAEAVSGVWKSPSGADAGVESTDWQLAYEPGNRTQVQMRRLGINIVRDTNSPSVWGSRTLMARGAITPDEMYVSVARTASMLRRSIQAGIEWAMVEPNDEALWETIGLSVNDFMHGLWRRGAFAGDGADSSYFVQCDASTMRVPPGGIPKILVGFAPIDAGQFVPVEVSFPTPRWLI